MPRGQRNTNGFINIKSKCDRFSPRCWLVSLVRTKLETLQAATDGEQGLVAGQNLGAEKVFRLLAWILFWLIWPGCECVCARKTTKRTSFNHFWPLSLRHISIHLADIRLSVQYSCRGTFEHPGRGTFRTAWRWARLMRHSANVRQKPNQQMRLRGLMINTQFTIWWPGTAQQSTRQRLWWIMRMDVFLQPVFVIVIRLNSLVNNSDSMCLFGHAFI